MARRKKGDRVHGWLIIDKPDGISSNAIVNKIRWVLNAQKAGHAGTLDPAASGLLAVALGEATKTIPYITDALKAYDFTVRLGISTTTDDAEGEPTKLSDTRPSDDDIKESLEQFIGQIEQVPPQFSAVKINGERAYALARSGQDIELTSRPLFVESLELISRPDPDHIELRMVCGKGGYVRSIARDLGESLGCFGHVKTLRRIWSGPFDIKDAISFSMFEVDHKDETLRSHIIPLDVALSSLPLSKCAAHFLPSLQNGNPCDAISTEAEFGEDTKVMVDNEVVAIGTYKSGKIHPKRVFNLK